MLSFLMPSELFTSDLSGGINMKKFILLLLVIFFGNVSTTGAHQKRREEYERVSQEIEQEIIAKDVELEKLDFQIKETEANMNNNFMSMIDKVLNEDSTKISDQEEKLKQLEALKSENISLKHKCDNLESILGAEENEKQKLNDHIKRLENDKKIIIQNYENIENSRRQYLFWYS